MSSVLCFLLVLHFCNSHTDAIVHKLQVPLLSEPNVSDLSIMRVGPKVSGLTYKSGAKWKILRWIYSTICGEVNVSVSVCVEIKGDYIEK
jgi:hypothetical protein